MERQQCYLNELNDFHFIWILDSRFGPVVKDIESRVLVLFSDSRLGPVVKDPESRVLVFYLALALYAPWI